jgi:hypothetical protein
MAVRKRRLCEGHVRALQRRPSNRQVPLARRARADFRLPRLPLRAVRALRQLPFGVRSDGVRTRARAGVGKCGCGGVRWPGTSSAFRRFGLGWLGGARTPPCCCRYLTELRLHSPFRSRCYARTFHRLRARSRPRLR